MAIRHLKQIGKVKKLDKWVPHELTENQKIVILKCSVLLFYITMNHFSVGLWRVMKSGFYNRRCPAQWLDQEEAPKHFWKPNLDQKKVLVTVWWSAAHHYSFLNPSETITPEKYAQQINEMHWKLQCPQLVLVNTKGPILLHDKSWPPHRTTSFKSWMNGGHEVLPHPPYSPALSPTNNHCFKHLKNHLQAKCFHNKQEAENGFQEFHESWSMDFYATEIDKHFSLAKMRWL